MREHELWVRFLWRAALLLAGLLSTIASEQTLKGVSKFDLPGPAGKRFDYLTIDMDDRYLLSTHLGDGDSPQSEGLCRMTFGISPWMIKGKVLILFPACKCGSGKAHGH
jgi:hypothetical protein